MEPPAKKLRPYVTKWQRKKEAENAKGDFPSDNNDVDVKKLFISDETVLEFQDKYHQNALPRKVWKTSSISETTVWSLQWCSKFSHLLAATCGNSIKLLDVMKNDEIKTVFTLKQSSPTRQCAWSRTSRQLLTGAFDGKIQVYDFLNGGKLCDSVKVDAQVSALKWWMGEDHVILVGGEDSFLASYDTRSGKEVAKYKFKSGKILSFDFLTNGSSFMASSDQVNRQSAEHNLIVWDLRTGGKISNQIYHERYTCPCIRTHPSGTNLLAQTTGNYIARFSADKPYKMDKFIRYQNHTVNEYPVSFDVSRDGHFVISGSSNGSVVCYKHNNGNYMRTVPLSTQKENDSCVDIQCHPVLPSMVAVSDWGGGLHILK